MSKKPWIWPACRSIVRTCVTPACWIRSATSLAEIGVRPAVLRSWRAYPKYGITAAILRADARFSASVMIINSIRLSLAGLDVDCRMNTSWPRTLSKISTKISESLKRSTLALVSLVFWP